MFEWLLLVHVLISVAFCAILWFVQLVHYPLVASSAKQTISALEQVHYRKTMPLAVSIMVLELLSAAGLLFFRPETIPLSAVVLSFIMIVPFWALTWLRCVPGHCTLTSSFQQRALERLLSAHLQRTVLATIRCLLVVWMLSTLLP